MNEKLLNLAQSLENVAACFRELASSECEEIEKVNSKVADTKKESPEKPVFKIEDVRAALSKLSTAGHTDDVKGILAKHGATKLSMVKPEDYTSIMEMVASFGGKE